jgi:hypothetical protein
MEKSKSPSHASVYFVVPILAVGLYLGTYCVLRWQHILVRYTWGQYVDRSDDCLYASSYIASGEGYGDSRADQFRAKLTGLAGSVFKPLCVLESEIRNRHFPIVRTRDGELAGFGGVIFQHSGSLIQNYQY